MSEFKFANVTRTYNGDTGCACGCGGDYTEAGDTSTKVLKRMNFIQKNIGKAQVDVWTDEMCYSVENAAGTRVTRVYLKK